MRSLLIGCPLTWSSLTFHARLWFDLLSLVLSLCSIHLSLPPSLHSSLTDSASLSHPSPPPGSLWLRLGLLVGRRRRLVPPAAASADHASQPQGLNLLPGAGSQNVSLPAALQGAAQVTRSSQLHLPASSPPPSSVTTLCFVFLFCLLCSLEATFSSVVFLAQFHCGREAARHFLLLLPGSGQTLWPGLLQTLQGKCGVFGEVAS